MEQIFIPNRAKLNRIYQPIVDDSMCGLQGISKPVKWIPLNVLKKVVAARKPDDISELEAFALELNLQMCGIRSI